MPAVDDRSPADRRRVLFSGYAPVHVLCFLPVYRQLESEPGLEIRFSGGLRERVGESVRYDLDRLYDPLGVDPRLRLPLSQALAQRFDVAICAHTSDSMLPGDVGRRVQIFHGVSFKNFAVREKVLVYDDLCLPGRYHAERFRERGLVRDGGARCLVTGMAKTDALLAGPADRRRLLGGLGMDPARKTLLFAPTGGKHNALETEGVDLIRAIEAEGRWNLLLKPHDHPKRPVDWEGLGALESDSFRLLRDHDVVPWLRLADLLITDASSVAVEYTLLDRPIVFVDVPRLFRNVVKRGAPLDLDTHGREMGELARGAGEVVEAIRLSLADPARHSARRRAVAEHVFHGPGGAAARVADVVRHAAGLLDRLPDSIEAIVP